MSYNLDTLRGDLFGGVTSMIVALPVALAVFVDLVTAVAIGLIAAGMAHARQLERPELDSVVSVPLLDRMVLSEEGSAAVDPYAAHTGLVALRGSFTVASSHRLVAVISMDIKDHDVVIFDFSKATYLDDSAAMVIKELIDFAAKEHTESVVAGISGHVADTLAALDILQDVPEGHVVETLDQARQAATNFITAGGKGTRA